MKVRDILEANSTIVPPYSIPKAQYSPAKELDKNYNWRNRYSDDTVGDAQRMQSNKLQQHLRQYTTSGKLEKGTASTGKPYNVVVSIKGPGGPGLRKMVDSFLDHQRNNYHEFADVMVERDPDSEDMVANVFLQATDESLLKRAITGGYYGSQR